MFELGVLRGDRAWVWRPGPPPRHADLKIVLPGAPAPSGRPLIVPGVPDTATLVRRELGIGFTSATDQLSERGTFASDSMAHAAAQLNLTWWRGKIASAETGPELLRLLRSRPTGLVPGTATRTDLHPAIPEHSFASAVLDAVVARRRLMAALAAEEVRDLELISRNYPGVAPFLPTEVGQALNISDAAAGALVERAEQLVRRLPATLEALERGEVSVEVAHAITAATRTTTDGIASEVEAAVLPKAGSRTAEQVYRSCAYQVARRDPDGLSRRHRLAVADRHVSRTMLPDGMAALRMVAAAQDVAEVWEAVTGLGDAARSPGDDRNLGQRRVDGLVDVCRDILERGGYRSVRLPTRQRSRPQVQVTMPLSTLVGGDAPAYLESHGWISAEQARTIAADADLRRLVCDPLSGVLLDRGRTVYKPPKTLADFVITRDRTCPVPGCRHPAKRGQLDHIEPAKPDPASGKPTAGTTSAENLAAPCHHHHLAKDGMGFTLTRTADGSYHWRSPLGRTSTRDPERLLQDPEYESAEHQLERIDDQQWEVEFTRQNRPATGPPTIGDLPPPF